MIKMINRKGLVIFLAGLLVLISVSCKGSHEEPDMPIPMGDEQFTLLIYMAGDNSMSKEIEYSLQSIQEGAKWGLGDVVVYLDRPNTSPQLIKITKKGVQERIKTYQERNSGLVTSLTQAIEDTQTLYPNKKYGLVIWSHGDGWLPWLRSTAMDSSSGSAINIDELADALPDGGLEYIWFDACFMGSIEVFYQLREKAHYLIGSPTEVVMAGAYDTSGIPYHKVLPYLMSGEETSLRTACQNYIQYYMEKPAGSTLQSASLAMVNTTKLEALQQETKKLLAGKLSAIDGIDLSSLQAYHRPQYPFHIYYDLGDVVDQIGGESMKWNKAKNDCVVYKGSTPRFTQSTKKGSESYIEIDPQKFSGLSCYLPLSSEKQSQHYDFYFTHIDWSTVWK